MTRSEYARGMGPALLALALVLPACNEAGSGHSRPDLYTVRPGTMRITIREAGELNAAQETRVKSGVEGQATIIYLVPEGTIVKKSEKLVELDASDLVERKAKQEIDLERAQASLVEAEQNLEIQKKDILASEEDAKSKFTIAQMELEKFYGRLPEETVADASSGNGPGGAKISTSDNTKAGAAGEQGKGTNVEMLKRLDELVQGTDLKRLSGKARELFSKQQDLQRDMGEMAQKILEQIDDLRLAEANLKLNENTYTYSRQLFAKKYISKNDLDRDQLDYERSLSNVTLSKNKLDLLINYTLKTQQIELLQSVSNASLELERVVASNIARRAREEADFSSAQASYRLEKERFENLVKQIDNAVIYAPTPGLVVYAQQGDGRRGREVVEEGQAVYQRQTLIVLPDVTRMVCDLKVKEADIDRVGPGQRVGIKVEAYPGQTFTATVTRVSPVADSGSRWSNNDLKVYKTRVTLDPVEAKLRPGMSAKVEIVIAELENVIYVPIQAVRREQALQYVWKNGPGGPEAVRVELGQNNLTHVEITRGLAEGDRVFLADPSGAKVPEVIKREAKELEEETNGKKKAKAKSEAPRPGEGTAPKKGPRSPVNAAARGNTTKLRDEILQLLRKKFPQFEEQLKDERGWFRIMSEPEVRDALENDPELKAKWQQMRSSFGGRDRGERRGGGDRGERRSGGDRGERRGGGPGGKRGQ